MALCSEDVYTACLCLYYPGFTKGTPSAVTSARTIMVVNTLERNFAIGRLSSYAGLLYYRFKFAWFEVI
ncbi:MAG: hypothetical protein AUK00_03180 [Dehalococcoidia bacterium CG2_30_46_9]|nr:MAG: hypothetical protein AUK00_03180 [Dehalococcoidia bacterium CG2_30_46_9]